MSKKDTLVTHNATEILREIIKEMAAGHIFTSRELYDQYLEFIGIYVPA
jgi:hypothetical protein